MKRFAAVALALTLAGAVPALAQPQAPGVPDTGNMAYPTPLPQGNIGTTTIGRPTMPTDTGNMAYPTPMQQGTVGSTSAPQGSRPADTGNMAYPAPVPQGNVGTTTVR